MVGENIIMVEFRTIIEPSRTISTTTKKDDKNLLLSPGERIQLYLGYSGSLYHIILNNDDGITRWQSVASSLGYIAPKLLNQLENIQNQNRFG